MFLFIVVYILHTNIHYILCCYCWLLYPCCSKCLNISYLVAIIDCTHIGSATASFYDLVTLHRSTADILVEDQLWPPLDMVTVDQEWKLHNPNSWTRRKSFVVGKNRKHKLCLDTCHFRQFFFFLLQLIKKWSSCEHLLEHLESTGTKIKMRGPYCAPGMCRKKHNNEINKLLMNLKRFSHCNIVFFPLLVYYLSEVFKACLESELILAKATI